MRGRALKATDKRRDIIVGRARIAGYSIPELSKKTGIPESTLYRRLKNPGGVNLTELELIDEAVGFDNEELLYLIRWRRCKA